jgi:capsular polysaccharide transport system ATP-binding protein
MITLVNVTKYYPMKGGGKHYVLKNVNLTIPEKESLAILGPNGAGKSTLLRMIGGAESPNSGQIISTSNVSWPLGVGVGFQASLTGRQNIQFACDINGLSKSETETVMQGVLDFSELEEFFEMPVKSYSSGMRAKLGFGLSIQFDFDYYLIDELTSVGDAIFRQKAVDAFEDIKKRASLVFVTHNLDNLRKACDSAVFLREGLVSYHDSIDEGIACYIAYVAESNPEAAEKMTNKLSQTKAKKNAKKNAKKATATHVKISQTPSE